MVELVAMNTFPKTLNYPDITSFITVHYSKEKKERNKEKKKKELFIAMKMPAVKVVW